MRTLLLASCAVIALGVSSGFAQAHDVSLDATKNSTVSGKGTQAASTSGGESTPVQVDGNTLTKTNSSSATGANSPSANNHSSATNVSGNTLSVSKSSSKSNTEISNKDSGNTYSKSNTETNTNTKTISGNSKVSIDAELKDSVLGSGSLSEATTHTHTVSFTTTASGGAGSSFNTGSVQHNKVVYAAAINAGSVEMDHSMGGMGILQANQNTGANAVQQNSVALTSTVGGNGGGLSGFSPSYAVSAR